MDTARVGITEEAVFFGRIFVVPFLNGHLVVAPSLYRVQVDTVGGVEDDVVIHIACAFEEFVDAQHNREAVDERPERHVLIGVDVEDDDGGRMVTREGAAQLTGDFLGSCTKHEDAGGI